MNTELSRFAPLVLRAITWPLRALLLRTPAKVRVLCNLCNSFLPLHDMLFCEAVRTPPAPTMGAYVAAHREPRLPSGSPRPTTPWQQAPGATSTTARAQVPSAAKPLKSYLWSSCSVWCIILPADDRAIVRNATTWRREIESSEVSRDAELAKVLWDTIEKQSPA